MRVIKKSVIFFSLFLGMGFLHAQEALKSLEEEYYDFLFLQELTERPTLGYRTLSDNVWNLKESSEDSEGGGNLWQSNNLGTTFTLANFEQNNFFTKGLNPHLNVRAYGPVWYNSYNSGLPYGQNDGALWQGVGYNTSLTAGARFEALGFEVTIKPQLTFSQNKDFELMPSKYVSEYGYIWAYENNPTPIGIDFPQRFGNSPYWQFDWGDSEIRWSWYNFTVGFGTQNPWLGPAYLNPMLGSNNAASFPKLDFGFRKTSVYIPYFDIYLGDIEGRTWCGALQESDYFDNDSTNDWRMLFGINFSYSPSFIPNFTMGINRILYTEWNINSLYLWTRLLGKRKTNLGWDTETEAHEDQKLALFAQWAMPQVGFEVYGEYGFDDFFLKIRDTFHTGIYTVGLKQIIPLPWQKLKSQLVFEWNSFEMSQDYQLQWEYIGYYGHGQIAQGYTNRGQILGAGSGEFGNSQYLAYKVYYPKGSSSIYIHRYAPNNNYLNNKAVHEDADNIRSLYWGLYYTNLALGFTTQYFVTPSLSLQGKFVYIQSECVNYEKDNHKKTFQIGFSAEYKF